MGCRGSITVALTCAWTVGCSIATTSFSSHRESREALIRRAIVWMPTDVAGKDLRRGPDAANGFAPGELVACEYVNQPMSGRSPKFACRIGTGDIVKVKFGGSNGEVYGEVAATRLLWALGFPADRMYPVKIVCHGCPGWVAGVQRSDGNRLIDPATIERKYPGHEITEGGIGWSWSELDEVSEEAGGAPRAHRDALKLLAVMLQHTDNKPAQQRLVCLDKHDDRNDCVRPLMMINDLGLTFGRASRTNANLTSSANLEGWTRMPVWREGAGCVGNLPHSLTGSLTNPGISEEGRRFLADLLEQLTDRQLYDLFDVARIKLRPRLPERGSSGFPRTEDWVEAFKQKRTQIVDRRCT